MARLLQPGWAPACAVKRIIAHWTAGGYVPSGLDRVHYHFLIGGDGRVVRGLRSVADNMSTTDGVYAAHTAGCNTGSVGVAVCAMKEAKESPFDPGSCPMTQAQWEVMARLTAELCIAYRLTVAETTVLGHGEVERILGIKQRGKWDPMKLPWIPGARAEVVGDMFRAAVRRNMAEIAREEDVA
jgi:N-acetyl-anhydromuramyl-L-alanine amidase AmpD